MLDLAKKIADRAVQYLADQRAFLRAPGEAPTPEQRQIESDHSDWMYNVRNHAESEPLHLPPTTFVSVPLTEQDVVGLFHQLSALGVFSGIKIYGLVPFLRQTVKTQNSSEWYKNAIQGGIELWVCLYGSLRRSSSWRRFSGWRWGRRWREVARAFEVNPSVLHRWRREVRQGPGNAFPGLGKRRWEEGQVAQLERRLASRRWRLIL